MFPFCHTLLLSSLASSALFKVMLNPFPEGLGKLEVERTCQVGGNFWLTAWAGRVPPAIAIFECAKDPASPKVALLESRVVKNCFEIEVFSKFPSSFWRRSYSLKRTWQVGTRFTEAANSQSPLTMYCTRSMLAVVTFCWSRPMRQQKQIVCSTAPPIIS